MLALKCLNLTLDTIDIIYTGLCNNLLHWSVCFFPYEFSEKAKRRKNRHMKRNEMKSNQSVITMEYGDSDDVFHLHFALQPIYTPNVLSLPFPLIVNARVFFLLNFQ